MPSLRFIWVHTIHAFLITVRRVIHTVCIFALRFPARPSLLFEDDTAYYYVLVPDFLFTVGIWPLVLI